MDKNFIKRLPTVDIYEEELKTLDKKTLSYYKIFLVHKLKKIKDKKSVIRWIKKVNFKQNEVDFFKQLRLFVKPPEVEEQYERPLEVDIKRGQQRANQFMLLFESIPSIRNLTLETGADDACGNGVVSKIFAQKFNLKEMDLFDPYVPETPFTIKGIKFKFYSIPFEQSQQPKKYDCFCLEAALHHIPNPLELIKSIKDSLKPGGLLFVREHLPSNDMEKRLLDIEEKTWSYGLVMEKEDGMKEIKNKTYPPESYFYENELYELIGQKPLGKLKEINYIQNEFMNYFIFEMK